MPIVTFSRMFGSGGSLVAARVASALGWVLLDNAVVDEVAARLGTTPAEVEAREERVPSLAQRLAEALSLSTGEYMAPFVGRLPPTEEQLVEVTRRVVEEAVARHPVVVVGRGAQAILAAREDAVHVFCYADRKSLVERVIAERRAPPEEAERLIDEMNRHRQQYVKRQWHRSWSAHENYHLCVNTGWLGIAGAADLVTAVARQKFGEVHA